MTASFRFNRSRAHLLDALQPILPGDTHFVVFLQDNPKGVRIPQGNVSICYPRDMDDASFPLVDFGPNGPEEATHALIALDERARLSSWHIGFGWRTPGGGRGVLKLSPERSQTKVA